MWAKLGPVFSFYMLILQRNELSSLCHIAVTYSRLKIVWYKYPPDSIGTEAGVHIFKIL